jgi:hypothetical protein
VARQRSGQPSGLIGRPTSRPGLLYRCLRGLCGLVGRLLFRIELHGLEHLPRTGDGRVAGGWIACGLPHRTWAEPFVLFFSLPAQPRIVMLGEGPTIFASRWRAFLVRRVGGVIPVWPGSGASGFGAVVEGVHRALAAGAVFALFPEVGPPARPPALRRADAHRNADRCGAGSAADGVRRVDPRRSGRRAATRRSYSPGWSTPSRLERRQHAAVRFTRHPRPGTASR